jgi:3D (Asp-Asp-Asp) domain-containing protein
MSNTPRIVCATMLVLLAAVQETAKGQPAGVRLDTDTAGAGVNSSCCPRIAVDSSNVAHAVWQDYRNGLWAIYYQKGTNFGATWMASDTLLSTATNTNAVDPRIVALGSNVYVTWRTVPLAAGGPTDERICVAVSQNGAAFSAPTAVNAAGSDFVSAPEIAVNTANSAYIVWSQAVGNVDHVFFTATTTAGIAWTSPTQLTSSSTVRAGTARVAGGGAGNVYVAYLETVTSGAKNVVFRGSINNGATFPSNRTQASLNGTIANSNPVQLALAANTSGTIHLIWTDTTAPPPQDACLYGQRNTAFGINPWPGPVRVDQTSGINLAYEPTVAVDSSGNGIAAYTELWVGSGWNVFANSSTSLSPNWTSQRQLSSVSGTPPFFVGNQIPLMRPRIRSASHAGSTDVVAVVWSQEPPSNDEYPDIFISTSHNVGSTWIRSQVGSASSTLSPAANFPDLVISWPSGPTSPLGGIVWDERWNSSVPAGSGLGDGAPESYFVSVGL